MLNSIPKGKGKIIIAALAGTTAGIIAGLLMASKSGSQSRNDLFQGAATAKDIVNNAFRTYILKQQDQS